MPELPEVETVCRGLSPHIQGKIIKKATLHRSNLRYPFPNNFKQLLEGNRITSVTRRAKYIEINLSNNLTWITHLGMTGVLLLCEDKRPPEKHEHVTLSLGDIYLHYIDPRRFGYMDIIPSSSLSTCRYYKDLGPEPFDKAFGESYIQNILSSSKKPIKNLLMDNSFVVGVGNIYANEILFKLGINPMLTAHNAIDAWDNFKQKTYIHNYSQQFDYIPKNFSFYSALKHQITDTLNKAIKAGGSTISDFKSPDSSAGYFPMHFDVYDREGQPCNVCSTPIERTKQSGRSTFYCPKCQK